MDENLTVLICSILQRMDELNEEFMRLMTVFSISDIRRCKEIAMLMKEFTALLGTIGTLDIVGGKNRLKVYSEELQYHATLMASEVDLVH